MASNGNGQACIFCEIAKKSILAFIVYEDSESIAFLDVEPRSPGHTLVVPKAHAESLSELPDRAVEPLFLGVKRVAQALLPALGAYGITIGINQGELSGVSHLHVHLMPRFEGDGGHPIQSVVQAPSGPLEETQAKIKKFLISPPEEGPPLEDNF